MSRFDLDLSKFGIHEPSLVLPFVATNIPIAKIEQVINDLEIGDISKIEKMNDEIWEGYTGVIVHFERWYDNKDAYNGRQLLLDGDIAPICYHISNVGDEFWNARALLPNEQDED